MPGRPGYPLTDMGCLLAKWESDDPGKNSRMYTGNSFGLTYYGAGRSPYGLSLLWGRVRDHTGSGE